MIAVVAASIAPAQRDIALETLARAMEGRFGAYARNVATGERIAINADKPFPAGAILELIDVSESRAGRTTESGSPPMTPRALADRLAEMHARCPRSADYPAREKLITNPAMNAIATRLSPVIEVGGAVTGLAKSPGVVGYAATQSGDMVFCVMTSDLDSAFTGAALLPEVVDALARRLIVPFSEPPFDPKPNGLILASLHGRAQDPLIFASPTSDVAVADVRRGAQRLTHDVGEVGCVAVLARPASGTRVTVQWWSPAERPESRSTQVIAGRSLGDVLFDLPLEKAGRWRVRVAFGGVIVLDEAFFVTPK